MSDYIQIFVLETKINKYLFAWDPLYNTQYIHRLNKESRYWSGSILLGNIGYKNYNPPVSELKYMEEYILAAERAKSYLLLI